VTAALSTSMTVPDGSTFGNQNPTETDARFIHVVTFLSGPSKFNNSSCRSLFQQ